MVPGSYGGVKGLLRALPELPVLSSLSCSRLLLALSLPRPLLSVLPLPSVCRSLPLSPYSKAASFPRLSLLPLSAPHPCFGDAALAALLASLLAGARLRARGGGIGPAPPGRRAARGLLASFPGSTGPMRAREHQLQAVLRARVSGPEGAGIGSAPRKPRAAHSLLAWRAGFRPLHLRSAGWRGCCLVH